MTSARARVEYDVHTDGVRLALTRDAGDAGQMVVRWGARAVEIVRPNVDATTEVADAWLRLDSDEARAVYEALAEHYGHTGLDVRALRRDYDAERGRVDTLLGYLTDVGRMGAYTMAAAVGAPLDGTDAGQA